MSEPLLDLKTVVTAADVLADSLGDTRTRDADAVAARKRLAELLDIAVSALCEAAREGNLTCQIAIEEMTKKQ